MRLADAAVTDPSVSALKLHAVGLTHRSRGDLGGQPSRSNPLNMIVRSTVASSYIKAVTSRSSAANPRPGCSADADGSKNPQPPAITKAAAALKTAAPRLAVPPPAPTCAPASETPSFTVETPASYRGDKDKVIALVADVNAGMAARVAPVLVEDCTGGVYLLRTRSRRLAAVFKPADEEPYAPNNPKRFRFDPSKGSTSASDQPAGIRAGIPVGRAAIREVAAYLLDHDAFAGVPATAIATASHPALFSASQASSQPKRGSLQLYVPHKCTADDMAMSLLDAKSVHAVAVLDIRLANQDRHSGNLLVVEKQAKLRERVLGGGNAPYRLVPIDHGACLPSVLALGETSFAWLFWPQAKLPFDNRTLEYIKALDAFADQERLAKSIGLNELGPQALLTLHVCTALLQTCATDWRLPAHEIGLIMCRQGTCRQPPQPSVLERLVVKALHDSPIGGGLKGSDSRAMRLSTSQLVASFRRHLTDHLRASFGPATPH